MNTTTIILLLAGGMALPALAATPDNRPSATTHVRENAKSPAYEFWKPKAAPSYQIERYGRISSRPWAQIAGRPAPALFVNQRVCQPNINSYYRGGTSPD